MTPDEAMRMVWDWGFVFIGACIVVALGLSLLRDAFKGDL